MLISAFGQIQDVPPTRYIGGHPRRHDDVSSTDGSLVAKNPPSSTRKGAALRGGARANQIPGLGGGALQIRPLVCSGKKYTVYNSLSYYTVIVYSIGNRSASGFCGHVHVTRLLLNSGDGEVRYYCCITLKIAAEPQSPSHLRCVPRCRPSRVCTYCHMSVVVGSHRPLIPISRSMTL